MTLRKRFAAALLLIACTLAPSQGLCADETALFNSIQPDVMVMIDLSYSMKRSPAGSFQHDRRPDCSTMSSMYSTDCRRYIIAKRAVFNLLDDNRDGKIDSSDETSLNVRVGYGVYYSYFDAEYNDLPVVAHSQARSARPIPSCSATRAPPVREFPSMHEMTVMGPMAVAPPWA